MKNEDLIHVQLECEKTTQLKKDILSSEMNLLKIKQNMKRYHLLRKEELKTKLGLYRKIKEAMVSIKQLQNNLPKIKVPRVLKKGNERQEKEKIEMKIKETKEKQYDQDLERQLQEIQEKLRALSQ